MTAKEFVKKHMPKAKAERHKTIGPMGRIYWLIRDGKEYLWFAEGETQEQAWKAAKEKIIESK